MGYSGTGADLYSLTYNYNKSPGMSDSDEIYALTFPSCLASGFHLPMTSERNYAYATYGMSANKHGETSQNAGINGTLLAENNLNYSVAGRLCQGAGLQGSASLNTMPPTANASLGYTSDNGDYGK